MRDEQDDILPIQGEGEPADSGRSNLPEQAGTGEVVENIENYVTPGRGAVSRPIDTSDEGDGAGGGFSVRDLLYVLFRHKYKIVLVFLLVSAGTFYYVSTLPELYESEARVLIRDDRTGLTVDPSGEGNSFLKGDRGGTKARTEMGIIQSPILAEQVVDRLSPALILGLEETTVPIRWTVNGVRAPSDTGRSKLLNGILRRLHLLKPELTHRQLAVQCVMGHLGVAPTMSESSVLSLTYDAYSRDVARRVLDALLDVYIQHHIEIHRSQVSPEFFKQKSEEIKAQLTEKENELDKERKRLKISSLDNQKSLLLNQFNTFDTNLKENQAQVNASQARLRVLEAMQLRRTTDARAGTLIQSRVSPVSEQLRGRLLDLKMQEADLASRFTDQAPQVQDVRLRIKELGKMMSSEKPDSLGLGLAADPSRMDLELQTQLARAELEAQNAREVSLGREVDSLRKEIDNLAINEKGLRRMEREVALLESEYRQYVNTLQISQISTALDRDKVSNVSIVQPATLPLEPIKSQHKILALLGFGIFLGLIGGVALAFVLDFCSHTMKTVDDIEKSLGLPVLVTLPYLKHHKPELHEEIA